MTSINRFAASLFVAFVLSSLVVNPNSAQAEERQSAKVVEILSGDIVRLEGGKTLRYAGISAPALQSIIPLAREYGQSSLEFNKSLVLNQTISVEWGSQVRDRRGNLLGYAYLEDGNFINEAILKKGWAKTLIVAPNLRHAAELRAAELEARRERKGIWKEEPENPYINEEFLGEKNTKIYYLPTSPELSSIPTAQLVKFRSRIQAKAAGYRACGTCRENSADPDQDSL